MITIYFVKLEKKRVWGDDTILGPFGTIIQAEEEVAAASDDVYASILTIEANILK